MSTLKQHIRHLAMLAALLLLFLGGQAQPAPTWKVRNGRMEIELSKEIGQASLDSFISSCGLSDIGLKSFVLKGIIDSLRKDGWSVDVSDSKKWILSKAMGAVVDLAKYNDLLVFSEKKWEDKDLPLMNNQPLSGANRFKGKHPFRIEDSVVTFYMSKKQPGKVSRVRLAGSFTNWQHNAIDMTPTDSGWIALVKLKPGKYWYKFIVDNDWQVDFQNAIKENDGRGNVNSVFYVPNHRFFLAGYEKAKDVFVAGSFSNWENDWLRMNRTAGGWELPLYLETGTHTYRFVVNKRWMMDSSNVLRYPNEFNEYNSVVQVGDPHLFRLKAFEQAKQVLLAGSFNQWRWHELPMKKTDSGWVLPYVLGPGNHQYHYKVDGKEIELPAEQSFIIVDANYTFRLSEYPAARQVYLAGDFNDWNPKGLPMSRRGDAWECTVHISPGKHRYKFVVDGKWILDPANPLWEENEHGTGNSVLWVEQ
jgi:hypothetical protein